MESNFEPYNVMINFNPNYLENLADLKNAVPADCANYSNLDQLQILINNWLANIAVNNWAGIIQMLEEYYNPEQEHYSINIGHFNENGFEDKRIDQLTEQCFKDASYIISFGGFQKRSENQLEWDTMKNSFKDLLKKITYFPELMVRFIGCHSELAHDLIAFNFNASLSLDFYECKFVDATAKLLFEQSHNIISLAINRHQLSLTGFSYITKMKNLLLLTISGSDNDEAIRNQNAPIYLSKQQLNLISEQLATSKLLVLQLYYPFDVKKGLISPEKIYMMSQFRIQEDIFDEHLATLLIGLKKNCTLERLTFLAPENKPLSITIDGQAITSTPDRNDFGNYFCIKGYLNQYQRQFRSVMDILQSNLLIQSSIQKGSTRFFEKLGLFRHSNEFFDADVHVTNDNTLPKTPHI